MIHRHTRTRTRGQTHTHTMHAHAHPRERERVTQCGWGRGGGGKGGKTGERGWHSPPGGRGRFGVLRMFRQELLPVLKQPVLMAKRVTKWSKMVNNPLPPPLLRAQTACALYVVDEFEAVPRPYSSGQNTSTVEPLRDLAREDGGGQRSDSSAQAESTSLRREGRGLGGWNMVGGWEGGAGGAPEWLKTGACGRGEIGERWEGESGRGQRRHALGDAEGRGERGKRRGVGWGGVTSWRRGPGCCFPSLVPTAHPRAVRSAKVKGRRLRCDEQRSETLIEGD